MQNRPANGAGKALPRLVAAVGTLQLAIGENTSTTKGTERHEGDEPNASVVLRVLCGEELRARPVSPMGPWSGHSLLLGNSRVIGNFGMCVAPVEVEI